MYSFCFGVDFVMVVCGVEEKMVSCRWKLGCSLDGKGKEIDFFLGFLEGILKFCISTWIFLCLELYYKMCIVVEVILFVENC